MKIRGLESKLDRELHLPWIAYTLPQETIEVEKSRRDEWVDVIGVVEGIEHLDNRNYRKAFAKFDRSLDAPVKREILVVLPRGVAISGSANSPRSNWLSRSSLHAEVSVKSPTHLDIGKEIKLVTDVAV